MAGPRASSQREGALRDVAQTYGSANRRTESLEQTGDGKEAHRQDSVAQVSELPQWSTVPIMKVNELVQNDCVGHVHAKLFATFHYNVLAGRTLLREIGNFA